MNAKALRAAALAALFFGMGCSTQVQLDNGVGTRGGGDHWVLDFKLAAKEVEAILRDFGQFEGEPIDADEFAAAVATTGVESTAEKLELGGKAKTAINDWKKKLIVFSRQAWDSITDRRIAHGLVLHEYLGIMRKDDAAYRISLNFSEIIEDEGTERAKPGLSHNIIANKDPLLRFEAAFENDDGSVTFLNPRVRGDSVETLPMSYDSTELDVVCEALGFDSYVTGSAVPAYTRENRMIFAHDVIATRETPGNKVMSMSCASVAKLRSAPSSSRAREIRSLPNVGLYAVVEPRFSGVMGRILPFAAGTWDQEQGVCQLYGFHGARSDLTKVKPTYSHRVVLGLDGKLRGISSGQSHRISEITCY